MSEDESKEALARHAAAKKALDAELLALKPLVKVIITALPVTNCSDEDADRAKEVINLVKVATTNVKTDANTANLDKNLKESISLFSKIKTKLATMAKSGNQKLDILFKPLKAAINRTILKLKAFVDSLESKFWKKSSNKPENASHRDEHRFDKHINKTRR